MKETCGGLFEGFFCYLIIFKESLKARELALAVHAVVHVEIKLQKYLI